MEKERAVTYRNQEDNDDAQRSGTSSISEPQGRDELRPFGHLVRGFTATNRGVGEHRGVSRGGRPSRRAGRSLSLQRPPNIRVAEEVAFSPVGESSRTQKHHILTCF